MIFFAVIVYLGLVFVLSIKETEVEFSEFEINRRISLGEKRFENLLIKKRMVPIFNRFRGFLSVGLVVLLALILSQIFKFWDAAWLVAGLTICGFIVSRTDFAKHFSKKIFKKTSPKMYAIFSTLKPKTQKKLLKMGEKKGWMFYSKAEMLDFLSRHKSVLQEKELAWIEKIAFLGEKSAADLCVRAENLDILHEKDLLTPMVIDALFQSGRSVFAVMDGADSEVLGVVKMVEIAEIGGDSKRVRTVMSRDFVEIEGDISALEAAETLISSGGNFVIVKNDGELVGILEIGDVF